MSSHFSKYDYNDEALHAHPSRLEKYRHEVMYARTYHIIDPNNLLRDKDRMNSHMLAGMFSNREYSIEHGMMMVFFSLQSTWELQPF